MKKNRQTRILELINKYPINKQEELLQKLREDGYEVTQSTISRDIKNLNLTKGLGADGIYRYQAPQVNHQSSKNYFVTLFSNSVLSIDIAQNIVVIKTSSGTANAVCATLDAMSYEGIAGTLAGDDTIFVACKDDKYAQRYLHEFKDLI